MVEPIDDVTAKWVKSWQATGLILEKIRREELQSLTEADAARFFAQMSFDRNDVWISPARSNSEGFIEQQRLFLRHHEHPARLRRRP